MEVRYIVQNMLQLLGGMEYWSVVDSKTNTRISDHLHEENAKLKADELNKKEQENGSKNVK